MENALKWWEDASKLLCRFSMEYESSSSSNGTSALQEKLEEVKNLPLLKKNYW